MVSENVFEDVKSVVAVLEMVLLKASRVLSDCKLPFVKATDGMKSYTWNTSLRQGNTRFPKAANHWLLLS